MTDSLFPELPSLSRECDEKRHGHCVDDCVCGCHGFRHGFRTTNGTGTPAQDTTVYMPAAHARATDPDTSHAAASVASLRATSNAAKLLTGYRHGPATHEQAADLAGLSHETGHKRTSDLKQRGFIQPTGRTAPGKSGSPMTVYAITSSGVAYLERSGL